MNRATELVESPMYLGERNFISDFLRFGVIKGIRIGFSKSEILGNFPDLGEPRHKDGFEIFWAGDLILIFRENNLVSIGIDVRSPSIEMPKSVCRSEITTGFPRTVKQLMGFLKENGIEYVQHEDVLGNPSGYKLASNVIVSVDQKKITAFTNEQF